MGEKDLQQFFLVKNFLQKKYRTRVVSCKTIRDFGNLALSSRNLLLNKKELNIARNLSKNLIFFKKNLKNKNDIKKILFIKKRELTNQFNVKIEYFELRNKYNLKNSNNIRDSKLFIAYYINKIRLIDNY